MFNRYLFNRGPYRQSTEYVLMESSFTGAAVMDFSPVRIRDVNHETVHYSKFNQAFFNRLRTSNSLIGLRGVAVMSAAVTTDVSMASVLNGKATLESGLNRIFEGFFHIAARSHFNDIMVRIRDSGLYYLGKGSFYADGQIASIDELYLFGLDFKPGDTIEISLCDFYISQNGMNIMDKFSGNFFKLYPGENILSWQDDKTQRTVEMRVLYQDKFL